MKTVTILFAGLLAAARAFAAEPQSSFSITTDFPYVTKYVFRGVQLARESLQPSISVTSGAFTAGVWTNQPIVDNTDNEFDLFAGYDFALHKNWKVNVGGTIYFYPELDARTKGEKTTYEPKVGLLGTIGPVNTGVTIYRDTTLKVTTGEFTLGYSMPLQGMNGSFDVTGYLGRVSPQVGNNYTYYGGMAKFTFKLKENAGFYAGVIGTHNSLRGLGSGGGGHLLVITGLTLTL